MQVRQKNTVAKNVKPKVNPFIKSLEQQRLIIKAAKEKNPSLLKQEKGIRFVQPV